MNCGTWNRIGVIQSLEDLKLCQYSYFAGVLHRALEACETVDVVLMEAFAYLVVVRKVRDVAGGTIDLAEEA